MTLLETAANDLFTFHGSGSILKTKNRYGPTLDATGRPIPPAASQIAANFDPSAQQRFSAEDKRLMKTFLESADDTLDGRPCFRWDSYRPDALGNPRVEQQVWYDRTTRLPIRVRNRLQVAYQHQFGREFETIDYDYPATGPADLAALGVPRDAPVVVVDENKKQPSWHWADLPLEVQRALTGQADAVRRLPRDYRAVTFDPTRGFTVAYWSAPAEFMAGWAAGQTSDNFTRSAIGPRHFQADNQDPTGRPADIQPDADGHLPADRIAAWLPLDRSTNINLEDGQRQFDLTRSHGEPSQPMKTAVHVRSRQGGIDELPRWVRDQWPLTWFGRSRLTPVPPEPDTPAGCVVIQFHQPDPEVRCTFTLDPARD